MTNNILIQLMHYYSYANKLQAHTFSLHFHPPLHPSISLILLQVSLCSPSENTPTESLARLVSMVFQWFHSTAYMMDDEVGSLVEKLKPQFVTKWLKTVCDVRFDVMVMCLLPKPVEFACSPCGFPPQETLVGFLQFPPKDMLLG